MAVDVAGKSDADGKVKASDRFDRALAMYLAAGRFCSPAGMAFMQQSYVPVLLEKKR